MQKVQKAGLISALVLLLIFGLGMINKVDFGSDQGSFGANVLSVTAGSQQGTLFVSAGEDLATDSRNFTLNGIAISDTGSKITYIWSIVQRKGRVRISDDQSNTTRVSVNKDEEFIFALTASDGVNTVTDSVTVRVGIGPFPEPVPTATISAQPQSVNVGESTTITWTSENTSSCTGNIFNTNNQTAGTVTASANLHQNPGEVIYTINCIGADTTKNAEASTVVRVADSNPTPTPPTVNISVSPTAIDAGQTAKLTWTSTDASSCAGSNFDTSNKTSGYVNVSPSSVGKINYSVTCNGLVDESLTANDSVSLTVNEIIVPPNSACSYPEGMYNTFSFSSMSKNSLGEYDLKSTMPVYKLIRTDGSFTSNFAYPIGTWKGLALFIGYGADYVETVDGKRYPVIVQWTDMTYPLSAGHNQRVFAVDMPLSEVEPYILPLMTFHNNDSFSAQNDNVLLGDMQSNGTLLGNAMRWSVPLGSEYSETNWIFKGSNGTNIEGGDSFEPGFYIEDGKIIGVVGYNYAANSSVAITTTPWLVRRLSSMVGAEWTERSITNPDTGKCLPLAPLPDFSGMARPSKYVRNSTVYNQVINN